MATTKKKVTAVEIYKELVDNFKIKAQIGSVQMELGGITVKYNGKDVIGSLLQDWVREWMKLNNYYFRVKVNTQEFPDFLLDTTDDKGLLEVKTFNAEAPPAFDIANFDAYCKSILKHPERLDADYLILSYKMTGSQLAIEDVWLKKVWEIAGTSTTNGIHFQGKNKKIDNIRPVQWFNESTKVQNKPFSSRLDFVTAISKVHASYKQCKTYRKGWLKNIKASYKAKTGINL